MSISLSYISDQFSKFSLLREEDNTALEKEPQRLETQTSGVICLVISTAMAYFGSLLISYPYVSLVLSISATVLFATAIVSTAKEMCVYINTMNNSS